MFENISLKVFLAHEGACQDGAGSAECLIEHYSQEHQYQYDVLNTVGSYKFLDVAADGGVAVSYKDEGWVGLYIGTNLVVRDEHARKGLGVALVLYSYGNGKTIPEARKLTISGKATLEKAYFVGKGHCHNCYWPKELHQLPHLGR